MFLARRPSAADIERFLEASRRLPLSYGPAGILLTDAHRGRRDEVVAGIGRGAADFERACRALEAWAHFDLGWVELFPRRAPIEAGTVVAVLIRHLGLWSLNGCRIISTSHEVGHGSPAGDERNDVTPHASLRFGFTYGTLPNHGEAGEERFEVSLDVSGDVQYCIRAISWPNAMLAHIGQPIVRVLQERFRRDSIVAMRRAVGHPR